MFKTYWPMIAFLALLGAFAGHGAWEAHKARKAAQQAAKIEKLEGENKSMDEAIKIRSKQNEIRNNRPDNSSLINSLRDGGF